jgi:hypothetical protein
VQRLVGAKLRTPGANKIIINKIKNVIFLAEMESFAEPDVNALYTYKFSLWIIYELVFHMDPTWLICLYPYMQLEIS